MTWWRRWLLWSPPAVPPPPCAKPAVPARAGSTRCSPLNGRQGQPLPVGWKNRYVVVGTFCYSSSQLVCVVTELFGAGREVSCLVSHLLQFLSICLWGNCNCVCFMGNPFGAFRQRRQTERERQRRGDGGAEKGWWRGRERQKGRDREGVMEGQRETERERQRRGDGGEEREGGGG